MNRSLLLFVSFALTSAATTCLAAGLPKTSVQAIIKALQDSNVEVRTAAAQALAQVPDDTAVKPLETALMASADANEQQALVAALSAANDNGTPKRIMDAVSNAQFTWGAGAKIKAIELLSKNADKKTIRWLTDLLSTDQDAAVKAAALRTLGAIGAPPKKDAKS
jgi:HEAT repeat protein